MVGFLIFVNLFIFFLAFFLDFFEIVFIVVPMLMPATHALDINLIWFGLLLCVNMQTSFMHPPFGFALFYLRAIAPKEVLTKDIYWGSLSPGLLAARARRHHDLLAGDGDLLDRRCAAARPGSGGTSSSRGSALPDSGTDVGPPPELDLDLN